MRGYIAGSGWKDYKETGAVCGIALPAGLRESDRLEPPIFTPVHQGGDAATTRTSRSRRGRERRAGPRSGELRRVSLEIYERARAHAEARGIILADTKFEFGIERRPPGLDRRGADARLLALLAARRLRAGPLAAQLRQAVRARLPRDAGLGQAAAGPRAARRRGRAHPREVPRGVRAPHGESRRPGSPHAVPAAAPRAASSPSAAGSGRTLRGALVKQADGLTGLRDGRQGHPLHRGPARVREALHRPRAPAAPRQPLTRGQGPEDPPEHPRQEDRGVQARRRSPGQLAERPSGRSP